jgi:hypothetical protein
MAIGCSLIELKFDVRLVLAKWSKWSHMSKTSYILEHLTSEMESILSFGSLRRNYIEVRLIRECYTNLYGYRQARGMFDLWPIRL